MLIQARVDMIFNAPFFGNLVMGMQPVFVADGGRFNTLATDGRILIINGTFFASLTKTERVFVLAHELGHMIFDHAGEHGRRLDRDPDLWNIAADHVVNNMLVDSKIGTPVTTGGFKIFCDTKYNNWSVEQTYNDLYAKHPPSASSSGKGRPTSGGSGNGTGSPSRTKDPQGGGRQVLDDHLETGSIVEGPTDAEGNTTYQVYADGQTPTEQQRQVQTETRSAVMGAARAVTSTKGAGFVPSGVNRMITEWLETKIDWRELLACSASDLFKEDYTYSRISKKSWCTNVILPGRREGEMVKLAAALDMSGSIGQSEANMFLSELWGIMQMYDNFEIDVWCYDTKVYNHRKFTKETLDELKDYQVKGGGGTDFEANYAFMAKNELVPDQFVNFTDGYPNGSWGDPDYCDTIFVITTPRVVPPFGKYAHFDN